jgi:4-hydroxy-2-oxoglutarate aldolase
MPELFQGVFAALTTPFENDRVSLEKFKDNIQKYNSFDLSGYVVAGSSGEASSLSDEEAENLVEAAKEAAAPGRKLIVGAARESTAATTAFTKRVASYGIDAALIRTPSYFKSLMTTEALKKHYFSTADSVPVPVIPYHIPQNTGLSIEPQLVIALSEHPNIAGMKDSSGNLPFLGEVIPHVRSNFSYLLGAGSVFFLGLVLGASGGILRLADVAPAQCAALYRQYVENRWKEASELQRDLIPLNKAIIQTYGVPGAKYALDLTGFHGGLPRLPILPLDEAGKKAIQTIVKNLRKKGSIT